MKSKNGFLDVLRRYIEEIRADKSISIIQRLADELTSKTKEDTGFKYSLIRSRYSEGFHRHINEKSAENWSENEIQTIIESIKNWTR